MKNKLIPTNGIWYKIKKFFKNIFHKENGNNIKQKQTVEKEEINDKNLFINNLKENFESSNKNQLLANKLLYGEIGPSELNETEVDEMTKYFEQDIQNIDNELLKIKQHIIAMQKELKNKNMS